MKNKKHILFISSWFPHRGNPTHGIFNRYFAQAASLYNKISILHVVAEAGLQQAEFIESIENNIFTLTVYYPKMGRFQPIKKYFRVMKMYRTGYKKITGRNGPVDLIHLNVVLPAGIGAHYLATKYKVPYVVNENWSGYTVADGNYKGQFKEYFTRRIISGAKAILPTSKYLKNAMLAHGLNGNYFIVPNVVNIDVFKPYTIPAGNGTTFIHISSLNDREKNVSGIIRAFGSAAEIVPGLKLNIVGEGVDKDAYEQMVLSLGLTERISFKGRLMATELVDEINTSDALVMFSNYETFCLVIIEAFACGKPVITSNAGAIAEYMTPKLGIMIEKEDESALKNTILSFANNKAKFNSNQIRSFAVDNYSYEKVGKDLDTIYSFALGGKKPNLS